MGQEQVSELTLSCLYNLPVDPSQALLGYESLSVQDWGICEFLEFL